MAKILVRSADGVSMSPFVRKAMLIAHVVSSVGWLGAVVGFVVLAIIGMTSRDSRLIVSAYLSMNEIGAHVIVPFRLASFISGTIQSLGTHWGFARYYWVLVKFGLTFAATGLLMLHQFTAVEGAARAVLDPAPDLPHLGQLGIQLIVDSALAVLVLLITSTLSVYKPWGRTRYGYRKLRDGASRATSL
ncbi:MAG TPA: hypothetical protein VHM24_04565 [Gemmatimonadaceae bacterium]|nr:hypothetical protein [Gemmatimonadaceae bacterium]